MIKISAKIDLTYELMKEFAPIAGEILLKSQDRITNIGKDNDNLPKDSEDPSSAYLTVLDGIIQDAFLTRMQNLNLELRINAEENTDIRDSFRKVQSPWTAHIDPIDGTKSYTEGKPLFSTGYAISDEKNNFTHTVIYVPSKRFLYIALPKESKTFNVSVSMCGEKKKSFDDIIKQVIELQGLHKELLRAKDNLKRAEESLEYDMFLFKSSRDSLVERISLLRLDVDLELTTPHAASRKIIYEKRLLSEDGKKELKSMGYEISRMHCAHMRVIEVSLGEAAAYLYGYTNPHDSMIPYAFAKERGVEVVDVNGNPITGSNIGVIETDGIVKFERMPSVCYFSPGLKIEEKQAILKILSQSKNLDQVYLDKIPHRVN